MTSQFQAYQRRFGGERPGLQLIAVEDAAIPVTEVRADVLAQEVRELPLIEEFTLRFVAHGVTSREEIAEYLGLDAAHVLEAAAAQVSQGHLTHSASRLSLTPAGVEAARTLAATRPVTMSLKASFDRLTWKLADYPRGKLLLKKDVEDQGMIILPPARKAAIGPEDVTPQAFNALPAVGKVKVLRVHRVTGNVHRYLPVKLLVYAEQNRRELELAVCVEDELAIDHGLALDQIEAVSRLGLTLGAPEARPVLDEDLESQRVSTTPPEPEAAASPPGQPPTAGGITALVRSVSVFEHADLLREALATARTRLLIIAPWVKLSVVTTDFLANLERRLQVGVEVTIAYGIGDDDKDSHEVAIRRLENLAKRYPAKFSFVRLRNAHAKVLIYDGNWINTSFNWLSFRGDSDRTYRMEEGTLVAIPGRVDKEYAHYRALIEQQAR
jgi:hypothetical protein